jgi:hyaluronoglucosaminidase
MSTARTFERRGIVEGFFGPPWTMAHRKALFEFGAVRGMNTYLYAPKDDPYHRERWTRPYPRKQWRALLGLIRHAQGRGIDFVYGFHPGKGLRFSAAEPVRILLAKARPFYDAGVRSFAVLFDDIPSRLEHGSDRKHFADSLARAEGTWLQTIQDRQPGSWRDIEWWICPSYYTSDPVLARVFGAFEPNFLETLAEYLPRDVACFWTGPSVVPKKIALSHLQPIVKRLRRRLLLWDNYPVNDLTMRDELHIGPLEGRDPRLPQAVHGYFNNPLLQEELSFVPLATCFDYSAHPSTYRSEASWTRIIEQRFGSDALLHWRAIRRFCEACRRGKKGKSELRLSPIERRRLGSAIAYLDAQGSEKWRREIRPWRDLMKRALS